MQRGGVFTAKISVLNQEALERNQNSFFRGAVIPLRNLKKTQLSNKLNLVKTITNNTKKILSKYSRMEP